jgi:hypothetical protein
MGWIEAVKFRFHIFHVGLFGDHAVVVGVHEEKELFDVLLAEGETVLRFGDGRFLSGGGSENGDGEEQDGNREDEFAAREKIAHEGLLRNDVPGMKGMYNVAGWEEHAKNGWRVSGFWGMRNR